MNSNFPVAGVAAGVVLSVLGTCSCAKPPVDPFCSSEVLPASTEVAAGQGALQVTAPTEDYVQVSDSSGRHVQSGPVNRSLSLKPGQYTIKLNNSPHQARVEAKMLTKCTAGVLRVTGDTDEYYSIHDAAKTQLASAKLGRALAFFPGSYVVMLNNVPAPAKLTAGSTTEIKSGVLNVRGSTDEYYSVLDGNGTQLGSHKLSTGMSFVPGAVTVKVNGTSAQANVPAGGVAEVTTGALLLQGTTDEYYAVFNNLGNQLASAKLGRALSFVPGTYALKVNNTSIPATVEANKTNEYPTGTLTVKRTGDDYYSVLDSNGTQLGSTKFNRSLSLAAGNYSVKIGSDTRPVAVTAGQTTVLNW